MPLAALRLDGRVQAAWPHISLSGLTVSDVEDALRSAPNLGQGIQNRGAPFVSHEKHFFMKMKKKKTNLLAQLKQGKQPLSLKFIIFQKKTTKLMY